MKVKTKTHETLSKRKHMRTFKVKSSQMAKIMKTFLFKFFFFVSPQNVQKQG